jgi:exopolysaccharide production protein ExoQ
MWFARIMDTGITVTDATGIQQAEVCGIAFALGFFLSFRLCIVYLSVAMLGLDPSTGSALSLGLGLLLFCLVCFTATGDSVRSLSSITQLKPIRWMIAFVIFAGLSLVWSETASLPNSVAYWCGLVVDFASVLMLLRRGNRTFEAHSILKGFVWSACFLGVMAWIMPTASDLRLGDEQFLNTNEIGNLCAFAIFFAQYLSRAGDGEWKFAKFLLVITLIRSLSKTTLAAFLVSQGLLLLLDKSISRKTKMMVSASALALVLVFWGLIAAYYQYYTTNGNQAETLTGRVVIWLYVLAGVFDHPWTPWIGHGFDAWWKVVPPFGGELFEARHAENELLQQLYAYGLAGIVLLVGLYWSLFRQLRKLRPSAAKTMFLCFLGFIVVRGLAESDAFDLLFPMWAIFLVSVLASSEPKVTPNTVQALPNHFERSPQV